LRVSRQKLISKNPRGSFTPPDHRHTWLTMVVKAANVTIPRLCFKSSAKKRRVMLILSQSVRHGRKERTDDPKEA
jgi:hypothetical protein